MGEERAYFDPQSKVKYKKREGSGALGSVLFLSQPALRGSGCAEALRLNQLLVGVKKKPRSRWVFVICCVSRRVGGDGGGGGCACPPS